MGQFRGCFESADVSMVEQSLRTISATAAVMNSPSNAFAFQGVFWNQGVASATALLSLPSMPC